MSIELNKKKNIFLLQTNNTSYAFGIDDKGLLRNLYWGSKINNIEDFEMPILNEVSTNDPVFEITPEEFPVHGGLRYKETCLKVRFDDGTRDLLYGYKGYYIVGNQLVINLMDTYYDFEINLHYKIYEEEDLIERWVDIKNNTDSIIEVEKIQSAQFHIPYEGLNFSNTHGYWGAEMQKFSQKLSFGKVIIENRRGISTHNHNPYFILDKNASETSGEVFFGALKLSGNFSGIIEQTQYGETLVQMGINSYDFLLKLLPGKSFTAPSIISGYTNNGFEKMTNNIHRFARKYILKGSIRPIIYNSWEASGFDIKCNQQINLAERASEIGVELFVVDDGWFGERNGIDNGLGDWYVNREKFPNGLTPLINKVKSLGMKFGIWVEPEMVNPLSKLYKLHPEWIYHYDTRESDTSREQYVLNMTKKEVSDFVYHMLDKLLSTYDISYIKWDANRPISQASIKRDIWYKHIESLYTVVKKLKKRHPKVLFEACASGGGRIDYGALSVFDDFWTSDNTDAYDRLKIQKSYSYIYPIKAMRAWVTDCPNFLSKRNIPMKFRYHSAMMGSLGIGCNILNFTDEEIILSKKMISEYKDIREIIQNGNFYRLEDGFENDYYLFEYLKDDKGVVFAFLPQSKIGHKSVRIKFRNLDADKIYNIEFNKRKFEKSGLYLMNMGIDFKLYGDYQSEIIRFVEL